MPAYFDRTSTHRVLELYLEFKTTDIDFLTEELNSRGHSRKKSDVKRMLNHLQSIGLIGNGDGERLIYLVRQINPYNYTEIHAYVAGRLIDFLSRQGFAIMPFLEAVNDYPNKNTMIQVKFVEYGKKYGFYHLREGDDVSAAMGNFAAFLGFLKDRSKKRGIYELTPLGKEIVNKVPPEIISDRIQCDVGEPCREICPTNAISFDRITNSCVECGLCTSACPYGAITVDCKGIISLNTDICKLHQGEQKLFQACGFKPIKADEIIMQHWIKSVFKLGNLHSEIPGVGEYPDIVTKEIPSFIEVKNERITKKRANKLKNQIKKYMKPEIINKTLKVLKERKNFEVEPPEFFVIITPTSNFSDYLLQIIKEEKPPLPVTYLQAEAIYELSNKILKGKHVKLRKKFSELVPFDDSTNIILS